jgi:rhodanese-related sulfurtransferase
MGGKQKPLPAKTESLPFSCIISQRILVGLRCFSATETNLENPSGGASLSVTTISPCELHARKTCGMPVELIDVRTPVEFREVHAEYARNVPLDTLQPSELIRDGSPADHPLYVICRSGSRGKQACEKFQAAGFTGVVNVEGGTLAWIEAGLAVARGKKVISLERQVRIAAGFLVLLGVVLGWLVHPAFAGLSAFVGAGLIFSGVTDTCGMGLMLARMPWNRVGDARPACGSR